MASLFPIPSTRSIRLLDPGAGIGILTAAFVDYLCSGKIPYRIDIDAYEIDSLMRSYLEKNLELCKATAAQGNSVVDWRVLSEDFIVDASGKTSSLNGIWPERVNKYTHCIMNPPYKKMSSSSRHRACLRVAGIETVNLYSAFVALSLLLLEKGGYLVAILPRSFCNGPYYRSFRKLILKHAAVRRIHLFGSRCKAFREDKVLQENIILVLEKEGRQGNVVVSNSTDDTLADISSTDHPFGKIVRENDKEFFIHVPVSPGVGFPGGERAFHYTLSQVGLQVSTGPVIDFRLHDQLRKIPGSGTVPLLYPCHFKGQCMQWPVEGGKKPNAILFNHDTKKWLYPNGFYTVVRRFSSKEEKRRIVAGVVDPKVFGEIQGLGLENHLNVFHNNKEPLAEKLARGLSVFLNSRIVDEYFRQFSGHTQVNATDLRLMNYPSRKTLIRLGEWAMTQGELTQDMIDAEINKIPE